MKYKIIFGKECIKFLDKFGCFVDPVEILTEGIIEKIETKTEIINSKFEYTYFHSRDYFFVPKEEQND